MAQPDDRPAAGPRGTKTGPEAIMLAARRTHRTAILCALACALLATAIGCPARARASADPHRAAALAQEQYYSSYGEPALDAALAQERYYSSYGEPEPLTVSHSPGPGGDTPWLPILLSIPALGVASAGGAQLHRLRRRHRAARVAV